MLLAMRRLQKVPNETKLQRIVEVLDDDHDGNININLALKVSLISSSASCWGLWLGSLCSQGQSDQLICIVLGLSLIHISEPTRR